MKTTSNKRTFKVRNVLSTLLMISLISCITWAAHGAKVIGINLAGTSAAGNMQPGDASGAPGVRVTNWNNINLTGQFNVVGLGAGSAVDNSGNVQANFSATLLPNIFAPGGGASATATNENKFYGFAIDTEPNGNENALQLTGIPYTNYFIFVYRASSEGSASAPRGGYFSIRDVATNLTYITNLDLSVTGTTNLVTNFVSTVWMSSTNFANPTITGSGYVRSFTTNQPSLMSQINNANYGILPGDPNPNVSYTTNIDLTSATTNVVAATNGAWVYFTPVGAGFRGVTGGDSVQRFKGVGVQIVGLPTATLTNIVLLSPLPTLFDGSTAVIPLNPVGQYDDGDTFPLWLLPSTTYSSDNTNVITVDTSGNIHPGHGGNANITITSGTFNSIVPVTVLSPTAIRLFMSTPTNLFVGNGIADKGQAQLFADFPGASTNAAVSNINVTTFNFVTFSGSPSALVNVSTSGLVTAVSASGSSLFSLHAVYDTFSIDANAVGHTQLFPTPGTVSSFGINIWDGSPLDPANFKDLAGSPGNRQAYWNNLNFTLPSAANPSNAVVNPLDYHGNALPGTTVVITGTGFSFVNGVTLTTNENRIVGSALDDGVNGNGTSTVATERVVVVTNVPYSVYDAYFYFCNQPGNPTRIAHVTSLETLETRWKKSPTTIPGTLDNTVPNPTNGVGYIQAVPLISGGSIPNNVRPGLLANIPAGNYIKFTGLTNPIAQFRWGPDDKDSASDADSTMRTRFSALQIVKNLGVLTPTNLYVDAFSSNVVKTLLPGDPTLEPLTVFADFTDGTIGGNVTSLSSFLSTDTNIFNVDSNGVLTAGINFGTANLIMSFKTLSITQAVTALAPIAVTVKAKPDTAYLDGVNLPSALRMLATFPGQTNIDISLFSVVSWNDVSSSVAVVSDTGNPPTTSPVTIQGIAIGTADISGNYLGAAYTNRAAFSVRSVSDPISLTNQTNLKHRYSFRDAPGSTVILDSVGGANGVIVPGLAGSFPLVLDGEKLNFPSNNVFNATPYIALPAGIISERGDVTIDMWCGMNEGKPWARFFDFGSSGKGSDEHNNGNGITWLEFAGLPGGDVNPVFQYLLNAGGVAQTVPGTSPFAVGAEQHVTCVYSANQGVIKLYINGVIQGATAPPFPLSSLNDVNNWLGVSQFQDPVLNGWISELRIYEGAFSDSDVAASDAAGPRVGLNPVPPIILSGVSGNTLQLSWQADYLGWTLQSNSVGLTATNSWFPYPGSAGTTNVNITIGTGGNVFFRLVNP